MAGIWTALFGGGAANSDSEKTPSFSLPRLQQLYEQLSHFRESDLERPGGGEAVVETVRQITEALIWGEQHDSNFFDFFCEKSILADFIRVLSLTKAPKTVKVQLLQTLSMLVQNIRREHSLFYLLSGNQVNRLITMQLDFTDEEILAYYITLLKSLAMRLDNETIKFFFITQPEPNFPLYIEATKFFNHRDQMVRATVRSITLRVYPIEFEPMRSFVQAHSEESYFSQLALHLKDIWLRLNSAAVLAEDLSALQHENDLQQDLLIYLSDVFELGISQLNKVLADRLLDCVMIPLLLLSLDPGGNHVSATERTLQPCQRLSPKVALFLLRQVFDTIRCRVLVEPLAAALLHPKVPESLLCAMPHDAPLQFHAHFVRFLRGWDDACFIFAAGIVHLCARNRPALSSEFLELARIIPPSSSSSSRFRNPPPLVSEKQLDILWFLLSALQRQVSWRPETFQVLVSVTLDLYWDPAICSNEECSAAVSRMAQDALANASIHLCGLLRDQLQADALLDIFVDEWQGVRKPSPTIAQVCADSWRMLISSSTSAAAPTLAGGAPAAAALAPEDAARRAVRCFLLLRRLLTELLGSTQDGVAQEHASSALASGHPQQRPPGQWGQADEPFASQVGTTSVTGSFQEGSSVQLDSWERIPCTVTTAEGRHVRFLLLHEDYLVVVQPDASVPGRAVVTTAWPVHQVQSLIDRGDPRILRVGMQAFHASGRPGEAADFGTPGGIQDANAGNRPRFFMLALAFEDVRCCHAGDVHLQRRRREVRSQLLQKALAMVECHAAPELPSI